MATGQDVKVSDVDAIAAYRVKFSDFIGQMSADMRRMLDKMDEIEYELNKRVKNMQEQYEQVKSDAAAAREEYRYISNFESDPAEVRRARMRFEHIDGNSVPNARIEADTAHSWASSAKHDLFAMRELTRKYMTRLSTKVENGQLFLSKAEEYIRSYKETHL